jgi:hypothetical protein
MCCHMGQSRDTLHLPQISPLNLRKGCWSDGSCTSMAWILFLLVCVFSPQHFFVACCCKKTSFLSMHVFIAINITQQSRGPELSYLFLFIFMWLCLFFYVDHSWITMRALYPPSTFHCGCCCHSGMKVCYASLINLCILFLDAQSAPNKGSVDAQNKTYAHSVCPRW